MLLEYQVIKVGGSGGLDGVFMCDIGIRGYSVHTTV
jgi:hypothetical protein